MLYIFCIIFFFFFILPKLLIAIINRIKKGTIWDILLAPGFYAIVKIINININLPLLSNNNIFSKIIWDNFDLI